MRESFYSGKMDSRHFLFVLIQIAFPLDVLSKASEQVPIVLWHGMGRLYCHCLTFINNNGTVFKQYSSTKYAGDSCCNPLSLGHIKSVLEAHLDNVYVKSLRIGESFIDVSVCHVSM